MIEKLTKVFEEKVFESGHPANMDPRFFCCKVGYDNEDGERKITHTIIRSKPSVAVIIKNKGRIALIRQFRSTTGKWHIEIPAGLVEIFKGETVLEAAVRETREESGLLVKAPRLLVKGPSVLDPSKSDEDYGVAETFAYGKKGQLKDAMEVITEDTIWSDEADVLYHLLDQQYNGKPFDGELTMTGHSTYALLNYFLLKVLKRYCKLVQNKPHKDAFDRAIIKFIQNYK